MRRIGVLTSGGDSPGMNAAIMAVARSAAYYGMPLVGIKRGYNGLLCKQARIEDDMVALDLDTVLDIADQPGTYLRTARCLEFKQPEMQSHAVANIRAMGIEGIVVIGGDGSYQGAMALCKLGVPCIGIPGTIDNDLAYTEMTLGYDTALNSCASDIRAIRATCRSHDRPAVVEVMGRHCGDIALKCAAATGSEIVVVPEVRWRIPDVADRLRRLSARGNKRVTIVVAEGAWASMEPFDYVSYLRAQQVKCYDGEPIDSVKLAAVLKCMTGEGVRSTILGYTQRGHQPSAYDAAFAFEAGNLAVRLLSNGIGNQVVGIKDGRVYHCPIEDALACQRPFNTELYQLINAL